MAGYCQRWSDKMRAYILVFVMLGLTVTAHATGSPGYDKTDAVLPKTTHAIVAEIIACSTTNERGYTLLDVTLKPIRTLWGEHDHEVIKTKYKEFMLSGGSAGKSISYEKYTGSGIEFEAKPKRKYICFLKEEKEGFSLLRMEPVENENTILELYKKQQEKSARK
jgi:hypothetical protein